MTKTVKDYWPGDHQRDMQRTLEWLFARQNAPAGIWQANALPTATTQTMWQCGIVSAADFAGFGQAEIENIVFDLPPGVSADAAAAGRTAFRSTTRPWCCPPPMDTYS